MSLTTRLRLNPKKRVLLTFDAFGTLYSPRAPIESIYHGCASKYGILDVGTGVVRDRFRKAFKQQMKLHPNYGAKTGLEPESWWRDIVTNTFHDSRLNSDAIAATADNLWHVFSSSEGYKLEDGAKGLFETLQHVKNGNNGFGSAVRITTGVITNSDPRVSGVIQSLGLKVGSSTTKSVDSSEVIPVDSNDIDFVITSHDAGMEKPSPEIFDTAIHAAGFTRTDIREREIQPVHIGDDHIKDAIGAQEAGWNAILVDKSGTNAKSALLTAHGLSDIEQWIKSWTGVQTGEQ